MASSLPNDIFHNVFQRFAYNIDLIEKRFANKRPCGLELDVDTGKIIQVVDAKRPRLTVEEAKEKMKKTFLAPSSLMGNSSLSSPFVHDMTASRETKKRVLKHNKRFQEQLNNGNDCSRCLDDENEDNNNAEYEEDPETEELFDLTHYLAEEENGDDELDEQEDDEEELDNAELLEPEEDSDSEEDVQDKDLEEELDNEKGNEEDLPFEEEDGAANEENAYKNVKITRALIERLTPKAVRRKKATAPSASKKLADSTPTRGRKSTASVSKKNTPLVDATPKATRARKSIPSASKKQNVESTPKAAKTKALPEKTARKTPTTVSKKVPKAASEKITSKKTPSIKDKTPKASNGKKIIKAASEKVPSKIKPSQLSSFGRPLKAPKKFDC